MPVMGMKRSDPVIYPFPLHTVFDALREVIPQTKLRMLAADPYRWVIVAERGINMLTMGEIVTVHLWQAGPTATGVVVDSQAKRWGISFGTHGSNIRMVFDALDRRLGRGVPASHLQPQPGS